MNNNQTTSVANKVVELSLNEITLVSGGSAGALRVTPGCRMVCGSPVGTAGVV